MKHKITRPSLIALLGLLPSPALQAQDADQSEFPVIMSQPLDSLAPVGAGTTFSVQATNAESFQWMRNGVSLDGQTNSALTVPSVGIDDAGFYSCSVSKSGQAVPTRSASLAVTAADSGGGIVVYAVPTGGSGGSGTCPGRYTGCVSFTKTVSQGWGWAPDTNTTVHTASDGGGRTDTKIQYIGRNSDLGCNQTSVTVPDPPFSTKYRFTIYFTNNVPTNAYPLILNGFAP